MAFSLPLFTGFYQRSVEIFGSTNSFQCTVVADALGVGDYNLLIQSPSNSGWARLYFNAGYTEIYVAFHWKTTNNSTENNQFRVYMTDGKIIDFRITNGQAWKAYVDGGLVESGTRIHDLSSMSHVEMRFDIADAGHLQLWHDGLLEIDYSGDTKPSAATDISHIYIAQDTNAHNLWLTNLYINDARCYERIVEGCTVDADAGTNDWDTSAGVDHYAMVDEAPPDDATTYLETGIDAEQELFEHPALTLTDLSGFDVMVWGRIQKTSALATLQTKLLIESNASQGLGDAEDLVQTWEYYNTYYAQDPDGPAAWDLAAINAATFGVDAEIT